MNLVIHAHTLKNEVLSQPITGRFDERGGTIGRSDSNTLTLPDPERHISRLQAEVWFANGGFSIRNVGSANPIMVNGRSIAPGEGASLSNADEITIGSYLMRVVIGAQDLPGTAFHAPAVDPRTVIVSSAGESKTSPPRINTVNPVDAVGTQPSARFVAPADLGTQTQAKAVPSTVPPTAASAVPASSAAASSDPFADLLGPSGGAAPSSADPFADLLGPATPAAPPPPVSAPAFASPTPAAPSTPAAAPVARLPDDFDPFADLAPAPAASAGLEAFMTGTPSTPAAAPASLPPDLGLGDLIGTPASGSAGASSGGSLDTLFGLNATATTSGTDPLAAFLAAAPPKDGQPPAPSTTDPLALFGSPPAAEPAPALPADFDHTPELKGAYVPPAVQTPPPAAPVAEAPRPAPPAPRPSAADVLPATTMPAVRPARVPLSVDLSTAAFAPVPPAPELGEITTPAPLDEAVPAVAPVTRHAGADALWAAFCEGAGIKLTPPQGLNPELMRMIGQILAQSMEGTLKLMAVRAAAKQELRAQVTTIQSRNNNPLKFSPDAGAAIEQLLQPPMRGFMYGPQAVTEAMDDLLGHAIGTMAGMRAALEGVLKRFEPGQLESKLSGGGVIDALLPMNRRAKLWELYLQHYERIHGEAQDDFHDLFGKAFIKAYEDQLDLLDEARHQAK